MKKLLIIFLLVILALPISFYKNVNFSLASASSSYSEIVMEVKSGRVLHENNARTKKFMASTTKILTAIVVIENCNLDDLVTVTADTVGVEGSSIYLETGEKITVRELLYGLMLRSGNDCAETLAKYCSGNNKKFAELMNETALKIGAKNSNFVNPHGLHDDNHYTTAYDLALISCYAISNQVFKEIVSTKSINISNSNHDYVRHLINKNKMLDEFDGTTGIKTGFTKKAGRCLVTSCQRNGMELVCVVLNCPPMWEQSKQLLTTCFNEYINYKLVESDYIIDFLDVENSNIKCGVYVKSDVVLPLDSYEKENLIIEYDLPTKLNLPIKKDQEIGNIKIMCKNNLIFNAKIYTIIEVK